METQIKPEDLISVEMAATALGRARKTIYEWLEKGKIKGLEIAGTKFVFRTEVEGERKAELAKEPADTQGE